MAGEMARDGSVRAVQTRALDSGVFDGTQPAYIERLYDRIMPIYVDLEEEPILGFTMGRHPDLVPSPDTPAFVTVHAGASGQQMRLAYAYLAAWLLRDSRGCTVPLPPLTHNEALALPPDDQASWRLALALLIPPGWRVTPENLADSAERFRVPPAVLTLLLED